YAASRAGRAGTFWALLTGPSVDDAFKRVADADGPWALVDGTPVANTVAELKAGRIHASIDQTELGFSHSFDPGYPDSTFAWVGAFGTDCEGWTATTADDGAAITGWVGSARSIGPYWHTTIPLPCTRRFPVYCLQVGPGAGPNRVRQVPAGAKMAF